MQRKYRYALPIALISSVVSALTLTTAHAAPPVDVLETQAQENWREAISDTPVPDEETCFHAAYPSTQWEKVDCTVAPNVPYIPRSAPGPGIVGNGADYAIETSTLITHAIGSFPAVKGVTSETDGGSNIYSIQLNSNFMNTAGCNGSSDPTNCLTWEQFIYSSSSSAAFMQYWLINYGVTCPDASWNSYQGSCYKNSAAVFVPQEMITSLQTLKLTGVAVTNGRDKLIFAAGAHAYTTSGKDSVVDLATAWQGSEFNIVGDGGGSSATFNTGSLITVKLAVRDGSTSTPTCAANAGTTGETNNLKLKGCTATGGTTPNIRFVERN